MEREIEACTNACTMYTMPHNTFLAGGHSHGHQICPRAYTLFGDSLSAAHVTALALQMGLVSLGSVTEVRKRGNPGWETSWRRGWLSWAGPKSAERRGRVILAGRAGTETERREHLLNIYVPGTVLSILHGLICLTNNPMRKIQASFYR